MKGKKMASRIEGEFVRIITSRSNPKPMPEVGGIPYSNARMKSVSILCACTPRL